MLKSLELFIPSEWESIEKKLSISIIVVQNGIIWFFQASGECWELNITFEDFCRSFYEPVRFSYVVNVSVRVKNHGELNQFILKFNKFNSS